MQTAQEKEICLLSLGKTENCHSVGNRNKNKLCIKKDRTVSQGPTPERSRYLSYCVELLSIVIIWRHIYRPRFTSNVALFFLAPFPEEGVLVATGCAATWIHTRDSCFENSSRNNTVINLIAIKDLCAKGGPHVVYIQGIRGRAGMSV